MLRLHSFTPKVARLGVAACGLAALAACGDNSISGPTLDLSLSRIAGFDPLKAWRGISEPSAATGQPVSTPSTCSFER